ncbi:MAG: hypothetical protein ABJB12_17090 [Pseudomonadota bacterium]
MRFILVLGLASCSLIGCKITTDKAEEENNGGATSSAAAGSSGSADSASGSGQGGGAGSSHAGAGNMDDDMSGAAGVGGSESGAAGAAGASGSTSAPLAPSNIPTTAALAGDGDLAITGSNCSADGKTGKISCGGSEISGYGYELVEQTDPDHSKLAVFSARNFTVESSAKLSLTGPYPIALVAKDTLRINGTVVATVDGIYTQTANAGGFSGVQGPAPGNGPGAGDAPEQTTKSGGGGGAFCGAGGPGGGTSGPASNGGKPYGEKTLHPLLGGSSGGASDYGTSGGGGGAIHLFGGTAIEIGLTGVVAALGGGGNALHTGAGSSGGAILIEGRKVRIAGIVTASGGGGGAYGGDAAGENGRLDGKPAKGGVGDSSGGDGSSGSMIDGAPGVKGTTASVGGSGGGGAGWIRINSTSGTADITGTLSPNLTTKCASQGALVP